MGLADDERRFVRRIGCSGRNWGGLACHRDRHGRVDPLSERVLFGRGIAASPGRVAHGPRNLCFSTFNVDGPIARNVADVALMLDAMVGQHPEDPLSLPTPAKSYVEVVSEAELGTPLRIAWSPDLGVAPLDPEVKEICTKAVRAFERAGAVVSEA